MLRQARAWGHLQARWVTGDEVYGGNPAFRAGLEADGYWYVLEVPSPMSVSRVRPEAPPPEPLGGGWSERSDLEPPRAMAELAATLGPEHWHMLEVAQGAQGPRVYAFAQQRVREVRGGVIGAEREALFRRNPDGTELRLYLANTPPGLALPVLGRVAATRWTIETGFEQAKGEAGLDEYEVRSWAGWHHHVILALLAGLFLLQVRWGWGGGNQPQLTIPQVSRVLRELLPRRPWTWSDLWAWLQRTQARNAAAHRSHAKRRQRDLLRASLQPP
jgi:SRSO17 transposase